MYTSVQSIWEIPKSRPFTLASINLVSIGPPGYHFVPTPKHIAGIEWPSANSYEPMLFVMRVIIVVSHKDQETCLGKVYTFPTTQGWKDYDLNLRSESGLRYLANADIVQLDQVPTWDALFNINGI